MPNEIKTNLYFPFEVLWGIVSQQTHHGLESHYILYAWKTGLHHQPKTHKKRKINVTRDFMIQGIFEARLFFLPMISYLMPSLSARTLAPSSICSRLEAKMDRLFSSKSFSFSC